MWASWMIRLACLQPCDADKRGVRATKKDARGLSATGKVFDGNNNCDRQFVSPVNCNCCKDGSCTVCGKSWSMECTVVVIRVSRCKATSSKRRSAASRTRTAVLYKTAWVSSLGGFFNFGSLGISGVSSVGALVSPVRSRLLDLFRLQQQHHPHQEVLESLSSPSLSYSFLAETESSMGLFRSLAASSRMASSKKVSVEDVYICCCSSQSDKSKPLRFN